MEYKLVGNEKNPAKVRLLYRCSSCNASLKSPLSDAGSIDDCPQCGARLEVPGKSEYARILKQKNEADAEKMARKETRVEAKSPKEAVLLQGRSREKESTSSSASSQTPKVAWYHSINRWLVENLAAFNAAIFLLIIIAGTFYVYAAMRQMIPNEFARFLLGLVSGAVAGVFYCGLFAVVLTFSRDVSRIAKALEQQNKSN